MYYLLILIVLLLLGMGLLWVWIIRKFRKLSAKETGPVYINPEQMRQHQDNLSKVLGLFEGRPRLTAGEVQNALGVSAATAVRYFDELEAKGQISQVGQAGQNVYYVRTNTSTAG